MEAASCIPSACLLGEGPVWFENALWWVDIEQKRLHQGSPESGDIRTYEFPERIGFAVPAQQPGHWILGLQSGIWRWETATDSLTRLHAPEPADQGTRFNDGKVDPAGRVWGGTMTLRGQAGAGSLYRIDDCGCRQMLDGITISNGLDWDSDRGKMYYIDTPTREIATFRYDPQTGEIADRSVLARLPDHTGSPDGMCLDTEGGLWVALWGGHGVLQMDPESGAVLGRVEVPAPNVTSCTFGGKDLDTLYITTARAGLTPEQLERFPQAGNVFSIRPGRRGRAVHLANL